MPSKQDIRRAALQLGIDRIGFAVAGDVGERAGDVLARQLDIDLDGTPEGSRVSVRLGREAATPGLHGLGRLGVRDFDRKLAEHRLGPRPGGVVAGGFGAQRHAEDLDEPD